MTIPAGSAEVQADALLKRLESVPFTWWHAKARLVMGTATFFDAFTALSIAYTLPILTRLWHMTPFETGVLLGASYVGQLIGALVFSALAERYGRVPSAAAAVAIMSVMSLFCALSGNFSMLLVCRLIQGIGVGGEMPVAAAYISELSPARGRGKFFLLYEMIFPVGLMAAGQLGALLVPVWGWPSIFVVGGIPGIVIAVLMARLPESPRWLIVHRRFAEAEAVIAQAEASTTKRLASQSAPTSQSAAPAQNLQRARWREVLSPVYRRRTIIAWILWACSYFVANSLNNWMPTLYNSVYGLNLPQSLHAASLLNVAQVAVLLVCAFVIDRTGRRNWTLAGFVVSALLLASLAFGAAGNVANVMVLATLSYGVIGSVNAVLYLYTPEIYPTRMRALGTGFSTACLRIASAVGPPIVGVMVAGYGIASVFGMFAGVALLGGLAAIFMLETRNRRLEDIAV